MAYTPLSNGFHAFPEALSFTSEKTNLSKSTASSRYSTLPGPAEQSTIFDNGGSNAEVDFKDIDSIKGLSASETNVGFAHTLPTPDMGWISPGQSLVAKSADTPLSMASFGMGTPNDDLPMNHTFPYHPVNVPVHANGGIISQQPQTMPLHNDEPWAPIQNDVDLWRPWSSEDPAWGSMSEGCYNNWSGYEGLINPVMGAGSAQPYTHFATIPALSTSKGTQASSTCSTDVPDQKIPISPPADLDAAISPRGDEYQGSKYPVYSAQYSESAKSAPTSLPFIGNTSFHDEVQQQGWTADHNTPNSSFTSHISSPDSLVKSTSRHIGDARNTFLVDCKRRGLSYKEIKRFGGFTEAESTLRGRYRTLTKSKDQRVRKPKWSDKDIQLLCEGVELYTENPASPHLAAISTMGTSPSTRTTPASVSPLVTSARIQQMQSHAYQAPKIPWKQVSEHIWVNGGSYQFGNATCKKKWCEIHGIQ
ncbi:unnamed protein product [Penicillium manginii]